MPLGFWRQPQQTLVRRAIFQIHLWTGVTIGIYIILISVTGSLVVFRRDLSQWKLGNVPAGEAVGQRRGDDFLAWIVRMHFGRYGGMGVRITYVILGLFPAALFVTGAIMWWKRVLRGWLTKN